MMLIQEIMVTTIDNPYNPFKDWDEWFFYDLSMGYFTCERLARIVTISDQLSDEEIFESVNYGIEELMKYGCINKKGEFIEYKKVYKHKEGELSDEKVTDNN
jgi:hypothetical protein